MMKSLILPNSKQSLKLEIIERLKFNNNPNYLLVKVLYSSINPSDFGFMSNIYGRKKYDNYPKSIGFEGVGIIEESLNKKLVGKKVSFCSNIEDE